MSIYEEIEVQVFSNLKLSKKKTTSYSFPRSAIQYYRQFIDEGSVKTMLFLQNSPKGLILDCGYDTFKKKLGSNSVDLSSLSSSQKEEVLTLLEKFGEENAK